MTCPIPLRSAMALALALGGACGAAAAQTVELRIVQESTTDSSVLASPLPHSTATLTRDYAVQARVLGTPSIGLFAFTIVMPGEADASGTPARLRITSADGTYYTGAPTTANSGGTHVGLAYQYFYFAALNPQFNGLINTSGGGFTNNPAQQEIALVNGLAAGMPMLGVPGIDPHVEGNPSTWSGYGAGAIPPSGATAPLSAQLATPYFGQGSFIDVYRFRYTIGSTTNRVLTFTLANVTAQTFTQFQYTNAIWLPQGTTVPAGSIVVDPLQVGVGTPGACCSAAGACTAEAQVTCGAPDTWTSGGACSPSPCPSGGRCCRSSGPCDFLVQSLCTAGSTWAPGGTCAPNTCPQPAACCDAAGSCTTVLQNVCTGTWTSGGVCSATFCYPYGACCSLSGCFLIHSGQTCAGTWVPGPCTASACVLGTCCQDTNSCSLTPQTSCTDYTWTARASCTPNPCLHPTLGICCPGGMTCVLVTQAACPGGQAWIGWAVCSPDWPIQCNISLATGTCCTVSGTCTVTCPNFCTGSWLPAGQPGQCSGSMCSPPTGACCRGATCAVSTLAACSGTGNQFAGANLACNSVGGGGGYPCCYGDYNKAGGITVQDIFDYLTGWFANDARTNINGGAIGVQDIFDFLSAWFAGCS